MLEERHGELGLGDADENAAVKSKVLGGTCLRALNIGEMQTSGRNT